MCQCNTLNFEYVNASIISYSVSIVRKCLVLGLIFGVFLRCFCDEDKERDTKQLCIRESESERLGLKRYSSIIVNAHAHHSFSIAQQKCTCMYRAKHTIRCILLSLLCESKNLPGCIMQDSTVRKSRIVHDTSYRHYICFHTIFIHNQLTKRLQSS